MGMVGCKLSHYLNLRRIEISRTKKPVLILEDDVDLEFNFVKKIESVLNKMPEDLDILLISGHYKEFKKSSCHNKNSNPHCANTELRKMAGKESKK